MREPIETIMYRNYEIAVYYDDSNESPDDWRNDERFLVYDHRQFTVRRDGFDVADIFEVFQTKNLYDGFFIYPVYAYIHSGVSLSLGRGYPYNCRFDTSFKGFALIKKQKGTYNRETSAREAAEGLIKSWNTYLSGDVYGYNSAAGSCCGFYGKEGMKQMIEEAKAEIDHDIAERMFTRFQMLKTYIKHKVPFEKRAFEYIAF